MSVPVLLCTSALLAICALALLRVRHLFATVALLSGYSGLFALHLALLGAPDVAFTEAVVGAGISTVLLMGLVGRVDPHAVARRSGLARAGAVVMALALGAALLWGAHSLPPFGDPASGSASHVASEYVRRSVDDMDTPNVVTAVLADYRSLDTLVETAVVVSAALACLLLRNGVREERQSSYRRRFESRMLRTVLAPLLACIFLFSLYVLVHGHYSPGGGFQAGVLLGSGVILRSLVIGSHDSGRAFSRRGAPVLACCGVLVFVATGLVAWSGASTFLDYAGLPLALPENLRRSTGILVVETGVLIAVSGAMISLYHSLYAQPREP